MMTATWSTCPFGRSVPLSDLGEKGDTISQNNGESRRVCRLEAHPEWLFKEYTKPLPPASSLRLKRLIHLPGIMNSPGDEALVNQHTSWPSARVTDGLAQTVGVLMPFAPGHYVTAIRLPSGRTLRKTLEIDLMAIPAEDQARKGLTAQALDDRIAVCTSLTSVAALFERHGVVYLDWSYANVFWSILAKSAYVIDIDGCSFEARTQIQSNSWEDPLVPRGKDAGNEVDRYRVALLTARCLTGRRATVEDTREGLVQLAGRPGSIAGVAHLLTQSLAAGRAADRPSNVIVHQAFRDLASGTRGGAATAGTGHDTGGVKGWRQVRTPGQPTVNMPKVNLNRRPSPQRSPTSRPSGVPSQPGGSGPPSVPRHTASTPPGTAGWTSPPPQPRQGGSALQNPQPTPPPAQRKSPNMTGPIIAGLAVILLLIFIATHH
jgi:hypothetical protein